MPRGTKHHPVKIAAFETLLKNTEAGEFSEGLSRRVGMRAAPELDAWRPPAGRALSSAGRVGVADVIWFARLHPSFTSLPACLLLCPDQETLRRQRSRPAAGNRREPPAPPAIFR